MAAVLSEGAGDWGIIAGPHVAGSTGKGGAVDQQGRRTGVSSCTGKIGLDVAPTTMAIWQYSELLLAKLDTQKLMGGDAGQPQPK